MKKFQFVFNILQRRVANIFLLSIMFSSLLLIFMVGFSIKDIFYDYMRSDYGNIPDMKVQLKNLSDKKLQKIKSEIKKIDNSADILYGYEDIYKLTITDSEDSLLAKEMPVLVKGIHLDKKLDVEIDGKRQKLKIAAFNYEEGFHVSLNLGDIKVEDKDSLKFISKGEVVAFNFCSKVNLEANNISLDAVYCKDDVDNLLQRIEDKKATYLNIKLDTKDTKLKINEIDKEYRTIALAFNGNKEPKNIVVLLEDLIIEDKFIEQFELYDGQLFITFKRDENLELNYKRYIAKILKNYINYDRFVLKVKNYSFSEDDNEDKADKEVAQELNRLNELTDFIDMILFTNGNSAISSNYMASDLNNFGMLDNFTITTKQKEFMLNIRSTFYYKPEKYYGDNILIFNNEVMKNEFGIKDQNNYIDIYVESENIDKLTKIKDLITHYDKKAKFLYQEDIIPSIAPKKQMFDTVIYIFSIFILAILFIAIYVVLRQFYSNFESELALLKLFGSNQPYQTIINSISLSISAFITYFVLKNQEIYINEVMQKYFFTSYDFEIKNYLISLAILGVYIILIYLIEFISIKKLNIIKGQ